MNNKRVIIDRDTVKSVTTSRHCSNWMSTWVLKRLAKNICYMRFELLNGTEVIFDTSGSQHYTDELK